MDHLKNALKAQCRSYENKVRRESVRACVRLHSNKKTFGEETAVEVFLIQVRLGHLPSNFIFLRFIDGVHSPLKTHNHLGTPCPPGILFKLVVTLTDLQIHFTRLTSSGFAVWTNHLVRSCKVTRTVGDEELRLKSLIQSCSSKLKIHLNPLKSYRKYDLTAAVTWGFSAFFFFFSAQQTTNLT